MKTISDARFTLTREFCGYAKPRYVLRFCGEWVRSFTCKRNAEAGRIAAIRNRQAELADECAAILRSV